MLLHARSSVVGPIPFLLAAILFWGHPYIGSTNVRIGYTIEKCGLCAHVTHKFAVIPRHSRGIMQTSGLRRVHNPHFSIVYLSYTTLHMRSVS